MRIYCSKAFILTILVLLIMPCLLSFFSFSADDGQIVSGKVYEFDDKTEYDFESAEKTLETLAEDAVTYGTFKLNGEIEELSTKNDVPAYRVKSGELVLFYTYGDSMLNTEKDVLHLTNDGCKKINNIKLDSKIEKGLILLQTSKDRKTWVDVFCKTNVFEDEPTQLNSLYTATEPQLNNGCFYRLIVAYKTEICVGTNQFLFIQTDKNEYKRHAEVYEFYAYNDNAEDNSLDNSNKYSLGSKVRTKEYEGYYGESVISSGDPHYGWDLGNFFVSGYTNETQYDGNVVFLKNVGDKVKLYFNLEQDINKLDGNDKLYISADTSGSDKYFQIKPQDFGKGALIIRYTDYQNITRDPVVYRDFLVANATPGADTMVNLFEEGDYEVALDYQITSDKLIDQKAHYRTFFKFSVRNSNCMVYPFDLVTGEELTNTSITPNGFRVDLAKSRYLSINVKKEVMAEGADGLVEDTRFDKAVRDGEEFTDEGIYTLFVTNKYTGRSEKKTIYVGKDKILMANVVTGLPIEVINKRIDEGYEIDNSGKLVLTSQKNSETTQEDSILEKSIFLNSGKIIIIVIVVIIAIVALVLFTVYRKRKNKKVKELAENSENVQEVKKDNADSTDKEDE